VVSPLFEVAELLAVLTVLAYSRRACRTADKEYSIKMRTFSAEVFCIIAIVCCPFYGIAAWICQALTYANHAGLDTGLEHTKAVVAFCILFTYIVMMPYLPSALHQHISVQDRAILAVGIYVATTIRMTTAKVPPPRPY